MGLHQTKMLSSKGNNQQGEKATYRWEKVFVNRISDKELISKIYEELMQLNSKRPDKPIKTEHKT